MGVCGLPCGVLEDGEALIVKLMNSLMVGCESGERDTMAVSSRLDLPTWFDEGRWLLDQTNFREDFAADWWGRFEVI